MKIALRLLTTEASAKKPKRIQHVFLDPDGEPIQKRIASIPYLEVGMLTWNKGTDAEIELPTLLMLHLPVRQRGKGKALPLLDTLLVWMKANRVPFLAFDNFANEFWLSAKRQRPSNVVLGKKYRGESRFGFVRTSAKTDVSALL